jgi:surfactin synthase thioesterase subunit
MNFRPSPWLVCRPQPHSRRRLYCFSYAGGSAANYAGWQTALDHTVEVHAVELPGRGTRFGEAPVTDLQIVIDTITDVIAVQDQRPFAFFGHSLGALLAFEVARQLQQRGLPTPYHLWVSGASAPRYRRDRSGIHLLEDDALINELKRLNGTPSPVLANRELMDMLLPMIRADFSLAENYVYRDGPLLHMPITVMMGYDDMDAEGDRVNGWHEETLGEFGTAWFEGDHFYINAQRDAVLSFIRNRL